MASYGVCTLEFGAYLLQMGNKSIRTYWMHYKADMFVIKSDLKETPRLRRDLGDAAIDVFFNFLYNFLIFMVPLWLLNLWHLSTLY